MPCCVPADQGCFRPDPCCTALDRRPCRPRIATNGRLIPCAASHRCSAGPGRSRSIARGRCDRCAARAQRARVTVDGLLRIPAIPAPRCAEPAQRWPVQTSVATTGWVVSGCGRCLAMGPAPRPAPSQTNARARRRESGESGVAQREPRFAARGHVAQTGLEPHARGSRSALWPVAMG